MKILYSLVLLLKCSVAAIAQNITTIAGTGVPGYSGDGGPATLAQLNHPDCIKLDAFGNKYIADEFNHVVRKISPYGIITTIAGNGHGAGYYKQKRPLPEAFQNI